MVQRSQQITGVFRGTLFLRNICPEIRSDKNGALADLKYDDEKAPWEKATENRKKKAAEDRESITDKFINAYNSLCIDSELPTMQEVATLLGKPINTVRDWAKKSGYKVDKETGKVMYNE